MPSVHGGIITRRDLDHHMEALDKHAIVACLLLTSGVDVVINGSPNSLHPRLAKKRLERQCIFAMELHSSSQWRLFTFTIIRLHSCVRFPNRATKSLFTFTSWRVCNSCRSHSRFGASKPLKNGPPVFLVEKRCLKCCRLVIQHGSLSTSVHERSNVCTVLIGVPSRSSTLRHRKLDSTEDTREAMEEDLPNTTKLQVFAASMLDTTSLLSSWSSTGGGNPALTR